MLDAAKSKPGGYINEGKSAANECVLLKQSMQHLGMAMTGEEGGLDLLCPLALGTASQRTAALAPSTCY